MTMQVRTTKMVVTDNNDEDDDATYQESDVEGGPVPQSARHQQGGAPQRPQHRHHLRHQQHQAQRCVPEHMHTDTQTSLA